MAIDMEAVRAQQRELNMVSDEILSVKRRLERHRQALDDAWKSSEMTGIDAVIDDIVRKMNRLAGELDDLGYDVMAAGEEIRAEEEEARRLAEEEARRQAEEEEEARRLAEQAEAESARKNREKAETVRVQISEFVNRIYQKGRK